MLPVRRPGALSGAAPQSLGLGTSQDLSGWGLRTPNLLLVASGVEYAAARIKVRANVDPIRQLRVTGTGSIRFARGGRSAHGRVGDLVLLPGEERGWV